MTQTSMEFDEERESENLDNDDNLTLQEQLDDEDDDDYDPDDEIPEFNFEDLNEHSDREIVREGIIQKYGFTPSDDYVEDLILFVTQLTKGS